MNDDLWTADTEVTATRALWKHGHLGSPLDVTAERDEPAAVAFTRAAARAILADLADAGMLAVPRLEFRVVYNHRLGHPVSWSEDWYRWDDAETSRLRAVAVGYADATVQRRAVSEWMPVEAPDVRR